MYEFSITSPNLAALGTAAARAAGIRSAARAMFVKNCILDRYREDKTGLRRRLRRLDELKDRV